MRQSWHVLRGLDIVRESLTCDQWLSECQQIMRAGDYLAL
jgi:hypothetical protein